MIQQLLAKLDGKKTYTFMLLYAAYRYALTHGFIQPMPDVETLLLTGAGLSLREAVGKASV